MPCFGYFANQVRGGLQTGQKWSKQGGIVSITLPSAVHRYASAFLDLIYPRRCEGCEASLAFGRTMAARWLCDDCLSALPRIEPPFCSTCGEPYDGAMSDSFRCGNCADTKHHFDFAIAAYMAEDTMRHLIHRFKYQHQLHLRGVLACLLDRSLEDPRLCEIDRSAWVLVPVPLYHARQREREYNQAWELCRHLSQTSGIPALNILSRVRSTTSQASLSRKQRLENLKGAFQMKRRFGKSPSMAGKWVLLVDDVLTTGSTASECARVLRREAGVEKVVVITVARG